MKKQPALSEDKIRKFIHPVSFEKGQRYYRDGRVVEAIKTDNTIRAKVEGSAPEPYDVSIPLNNIRDAECSCPIGESCKHIAAVLLSVLHSGRNVTEINTTTIRDALLAKRKEELADIILRKADKDSGFLKSLFVQATTESKKSIDPSFFRNQIDSLLCEADGIPYAAVYSYVTGLEEFAEETKRLLKSSPALGFEVFLYFAERSIWVYDETGLDDSDGNFGVFVDFLIETCASFLKAAGSRPSAKDILSLYFRASNYGFRESLNTLLTALPQPVLEKLEFAGREKIKERENKKNWEARTDGYFYASILALLGKKTEYEQLCREWKEDHWLGEIRELDKNRHLSHNDKTKEK